jgi:hypothetical protein
VNKSDVFSYNFGNPDLKPARHHVYNLNYFLPARRGSIGFLANYNYGNNSIQSYSYIGADSILYNTFANIGKYRNTMLTFSFTRQFLGIVNLSLNSSVRFSEYTGKTREQMIQQKGFNYYGSVLIGITLFSDGYLSGMASYSSGDTKLQGSSNSYMDSNLSLNWDLGKKKNFSMELSCDNPFQGNRVIRYLSDNPQFYQISETILKDRTITLTAAYRFGSYSGPLKRKQRGIYNDDL